MCPGHRAGQGGGANGAYRVLLSQRLSERYPGVVIDDCSVGGAVNADLLGEQIPNCFDEPEDRRTLVIFTFDPCPSVSPEQLGLLPSFCPPQ